MLAQIGWSVLGVTWDENRLPREGAASQGRRCADAAVNQAPSDRPILAVATSLGTLAQPWAIKNRLPGVWLNPLLHDTAVAAAVTGSAADHAACRLNQTTLMGNHRRRPVRVSPCWSYLTQTVVCSSGVTGAAPYCTGRDLRPSVPASRTDPAHHEPSRTVLNKGLGSGVPRRLRRMIGVRPEGRRKGHPAAIRVAEGFEGGQGAGRVTLLA